MSIRRVSEREHEDSQVSVEHVDVVDVTSVDKGTGHVVLTISDHLDWSDSGRHQAVLQKKLNAYLSFIESGELLKHFPDAKGRRVAINIVFKFRPDREGTRFLERAKHVIASAGFELRHELFAESSGN